MQHAIKRKVVNEGTATETLKQVRLWYVRPNHLVELRGLWHSGTRKRPVEIDFCRQGPKGVLRSAAGHEELAAFGRDFRYGDVELARGSIKELRPQHRRRVANLAPRRFDRHASDRSSFER